jgi:hypothetical protein
MGDRSRSHGAVTFGHRSTLLGYIVTETGTSQRILPHAIEEKLMLSSSGVATAGSTRPVTVQVTPPGLATVIQYELRTP